MQRFSGDTTVGTEIEIQGMSRRGTVGLERIVEYTTHDDGSIRSPVYHVGGVGIIPQTDAKGAPILCAQMERERDYGLEVITEPYTFDKFFDISEQIAEFFGHLPQTPRTSIHIHVDISQMPWKKIRNVLLWARYLEAPLYRIAAGGGIHRGERSYKGQLNDHRYARPLSAPIYAEWTDGRKSLVDWSKIESARTATEFVAAWGRLDYFMHNGLIHYCPHRLHMLNLASIMRQGTLEWRLFDGIYRLYPLFIKVVYGIHRLAEDGPPDSMSYFDLGSTPSLDSDFVSSLVGVDVAPAWGTLWGRGVDDQRKFHHYNDVPTIPSDRPMFPIRAINSGRTDDGSADFPLYVRD